MDTSVCGQPLLPFCPPGREAGLKLWGEARREHMLQMLKAAQPWFHVLMGSARTECCHLSPAEARLVGGSLCVLHWMLPRWLP